MPQKQHTAQEYVIVRLSAIGDVSLCTGFVKYWHEHNNAMFTVITKKGFGCLFANHPGVKEVIELDLKELPFFKMLAKFSELAKKYKNIPLLDLHGNLRTKILAALWQAPVKRYAKLAFKRRCFLYLKDKCPSCLAMDNNSVAQRYALSLSASVIPAQLLEPKVYLTAAESARGRQLLASTLPEAQAISKIVALHPYASHEPKAWPKEHWLKLAELLDAAKISWLCIGQNQNKFFNTSNDLTNASDLRQTLAILEACAVLVTPDSGPMHLARAVKTPVVALFGPTVKEWGFYPNKNEGVVLETPLPCRPCSLHGKKKCQLPANENCLLQISPEKVFASIVELLSQTKLCEPS